MPPKGFKETFVSLAKQGHATIKERKVLSGIARKMGWKTAANILHQLGYGRGGQIGGAAHAMAPDVITSVPMHIQPYPGYMGDPTTIRRKGQRGGSFWSWIKGAANTVYNKAIKPVAKVVKPIANAVGTVASFIPHPVAQGIATGAKVVSKGAELAGGARGRRAGFDPSGLSFD